MAKKLEGWNHTLDWYNKNYEKYDFGDIGGLDDDDWVDRDEYFGEEHVDRSYRDPRVDAEIGQVFTNNDDYEFITKTPSYEAIENGIKARENSTTDSSASSDANENTFTKFVEALDKVNQGKNNPFANFGNIGESIAKGISLLDPNGDKALLTTEQKVNYANNNIANLSDENKNKLNEYNNILDELDASRMSLTDNFNPEENERFAENSQRLKDLKASLQKDLNIDDDTFNKYVSSSKFLKNLEDRQRQQEEYANASAGEKALANIGDALLAPIRPYVTLKGYLDEKGNPYYDENLGVDHNATGFDMANINRDITTQATKDIEELTGANEEDASLGSKAANEVLKTLYTGVKSGADSMARLATGEVSTLLGAGLEAADQQYVDAQERGLTNAQAIGTALSSGAAEAVFEKIPVDNMLKLWKNGAESATKGGVKAAVKDILKQAGLEGMEEVETDIANKFSDAIINKDKSEFNTQVEDYKAQGMDEAEAFGRTLLDNVADTVESFAGGAIGGLVGGGGAIAGSVATTKEAKKLDGNYREIAQAIPDNVEDYNSEEAYNKAMEVKARAEELDTQDKVSSADRSGLLQDIYAVNETMPNTDLIENINESVNSPFANVGGFQVAKNDITSQQVAKSMASAQNVNDFVEAYRDSQASSDIQARQIGQQYFETLAPKFDDYNEGSRPLDIAMSQRSAEDIYNAALNNEEVAQEELNTARKQQLFQRGVAQYNLNRQIEAQRQVRQEESKTVAPEKLHNIETPQGKADIADITMSDDGSFVWKKGEEEVVIPKKDISDNAMKRFMVNATNQPTLSAKQLYVDNYDGSIPIGSYNNAYNSAFNAGKLGHGTFKSWLSAKKFYAKQIPTETLEAFYNEGAKQLKGVSKKVTKARIKGTGKVTVEKGVENTPIHRLAEAIASKTGVDFEIRDGSILVTDSAQNALKDEEGNEIYSNGQFKADVSKVVLGVNDKAYQTLAHEAIGEFLEAYNPEDMQEIQDTILTYLLEEKGDEYVDNTIKRYQRLYQSAEGSKSYRDAANEMVNDTLIGLFTTDKGAKDFVDWCNSNNKKSTLDKIADFIQAIIDKLKSLISDANLSSEARTVAEMSEKQAQKIRDRLFKAMDKAIENYQGSEEETTDGSSTTYSLDVDSAIRQEGNNLVLENPDNITDTQWKSIAKEFNLLGYGIGDWKAHKEVFTRLSQNRGYSFNDDQAEAIAKIFNISNTTDNASNVDIKAIVQKAEKHFGTTRKFDLAGYLDVNGKLIDFSDGQRYRVQDHREISEILDLPDDAGYSDGLIQFMGMGNIRMQPYGIDIAVKPNKAQKDRLYDFFESLDGEVTVDFSTKAEGATVGSANYSEGTSPQRILNDIDSYFETGEVPEGTDDGNVYYSLDVDSEGRELSEGQKQFYADESELLLDDKGRLKRYYHGTPRVDRVGTVFRNDRATSGPMAFFTDDKRIAENYSKDKEDTSLSRDEKYDSYYTQFRVNINGEDLSIEEAWNKLPISKRNEIRKKAEHITVDWDNGEDIIYDDNNEYGLGNFDPYTINSHKGNYLGALVESWLESGELLNYEEDFIKVLELAGLDNVKYLDPSYREEGIYEVYLHITNPLLTTDIPQETFDAIKNASKEVSEEEYFRADYWDKNSRKAEDWVDALADDIANNTTTAWTSIPDWVTDTLKSLGYDGIVDEGGKYHETGHQVVIPFESNQVKRIDNKNPTDNEDIRYSLDVPTTYALDEEYSPFIDDDIAETKESKGAFVEIIKAANSTLNYHISDKRIEDIADKVIAQYSSNIDKDFVTKNLRNIFDAMSDNNIEDMSNALINLSEEVIRQSEDVDPYEKENYEDFARNMPTFTLSENQKQEAINIMGDWNTVFAAVGRFLNNDSHTLDGNTYWDICDNALAHGYTMDRDASDTEQLSNIISAIDALTPQSRALFKGADITDASLVTANEIMQQYYDYALKDKQANANLTDVKADLRKQVEDYKKAIGKQYQEQVKRLQKEIKDLKEQQKYTNQQGQQLYDRLAKAEKSGDSELVKNLKQENWQLNSDLKQAERMASRDKTSISRYMEREARNKHLNSIKKQAIRLIKMIDAPTRDKFVPDVIKEQTIEMLQAFDFVTYRVRKNGELVPWGEEKGGEPTKTTQEWHQRMELLQNALNELEKVPQTELVERYGASANYVFNLSVQMGDVTKGLLDQFLEETKDSKVRLSTLKSDKLKILDDFMKSFNASINKAQEAFIDGKNVKLDQIGKDIVSEIGELKSLNAIEGSGKKKVLDFLNLDMAEPVTFFSELGETFEKMFWHLAQGKNVRDKHIFDTEDAFAKKKEELGIDKNEPNKWEKGVKSFKNGRLQLTTAQIMSLYAAYQRSQARRHILFGGVMSEDKSLITRKDRKAKRVQNDPVHLTPQDVEEITSTLTEKQKALADFMVEYMSNEVSSWGNRVSQLKWGIKLFTESHYFPIKTYDKTRPSKVQEENGNGSLYALQNQGFTKPLQQDANNALILDDIFSVFADHVAKMAAYDGYVIPISDFMRVYNFAESEEQFVNFGVEEGNHRNDESVKGQIERVFGKGGNNYVRQFIKNVNEDYGEGGSVTVIDKLFSNNKAQAVLANGRVVIQQPTAYPRAMEVIEGKYLVKALSVAGVGIRRKIQRSKSHNSLAKFKSKGYYETSIGQSMKQMITGTATPKEKINEVAGALAGLMDDFTWSVIYNAAEQKVQAEQPKLEKDSKEYFAAVNKIADEAFIKTQVVDSVFTKSQMMRSRDTGDKMLTAFMAEPTKYYNMLHRGVFNMIQTGDKKVFAKAVYLFVVGQVLNSVAQSIYDAWRDDDDEKNAMEKFLNALIGIDDVAEANGTWATMQAILKTNLFENLLPLNLLPVVKEVTSALAGWDSKNMSTQAIYDIIGDAQKIFNAAEGKGNLTPYGVLNASAHALSLATGMPISSALREVKDLYNNLNNLWDGKNIVKTETKQNPVVQAIESGKDIASVAKEQKQEKIQKALEEGKTQKEAESSAKSSMASSITSKYKDKLIELKDEDINKANELKQNLLDAYVAIGYSRSDANDKINKWFK